MGSLSTIIYLKEETDPKIPKSGIILVSRLHFGECFIPVKTEQFRMGIFPWQFVHRLHVCAYVTLYIVWVSSIGVGEQ